MRHYLKSGDTGTMLCAASVMKTAQNARPHSSQLQKRIADGEEVEAVVPRLLEKLQNKRKKPDRMVGGTREGHLCSACRQRERTGKEKKAGTMAAAHPPERSPGM